MKEAPVGVAVGIDEAGNRSQSLGVDDPTGVSLCLTYGLDLISLYSNGAVVLFFFGSIYNGCVLDENIVFSHKNL